MTDRPRRTPAPLALVLLTLLLVPPGVSASPGPAASPSGSAAPVSLVPEDGTLTIGYSDTAFLARLPLVLAERRGYLRDAGFTDVRTMELEEPLPGVLNGELDLAIIDARQAADAFALGLPVHAVAGYRVAPVPSTTPMASGAPDASPDASDTPEAVASPGAAASLVPPSSPTASLPPAPSSPWVAMDVVVASADTLATRPGTVAAFTGAHVRALQDLRARLEGIEPGASPGASPGTDPGTSPAASFATTPTTSPGTGPEASPVPSPRYGDPILDAASLGGLEVPPDVLADWPAPLAAYLPFDGGFDDPTTGDGLGSLRNLSLADPATTPDLAAFVATPTLHAAQQALGVAPNPHPSRDPVPASPPSPGPSAAAAP
jgi:hypothetical protein